MKMVFAVNYDRIDFRISNDLKDSAIEVVESAQQDSVQRSLPTGYNLANRMVEWATGSYKNQPFNTFPIVYVCNIDTFHDIVSYVQEKLKLEEYQSEQA